MKLFAEVDVDKNGTLDFEEFHVLVRKLRQRPELQGAHIQSSVETFPKKCCWYPTTRSSRSWRWLLTCRGYRLAVLWSAALRKEWDTLNASSAQALAAVPLHADDLLKTLPLADFHLYLTKVSPVDVSPYLCCMV